MSALDGLAPAPDLIRPLIGFRQWRLARDGGLRSLVYDEPWPSATMTARCRVAAHEEAPVEDCTCGVYAWYRPCPLTSSCATRDLVAGAVVVWGAVELHATGMRAQCCRVVALALPLSRGRKRRRVCAAAERLGVPVVPHRALPWIANAHGGPVPDALKPEWDRSLGRGLSAAS